MFQEFKEAVNNINSYADILDVFLLYYFDQEMLVWYKHLLDNRMALKKQAQIGIFYNLPQDVICRRLQKLQRYIKKITKDLDRNREQFIYLLDYIDKNKVNVCVFTPTFMRYLLLDRSYNEVTPMIITSIKIKSYEDKYNTSRIKGKDRRTSRIGKQTTSTVPTVQLYQRTKLCQLSRWNNRK